MNSNPKGEGVNTQTPIGQSPASSNEQQGFENRIAKGTTGSRPDMSSKYGGDGDAGVLFKGSSAGDQSSRESNSGKNEKDSAGTGQYSGGGKAAFEAGGFGSREQMPKYGKEQNEGKLIGDGAGATAFINGTDQLKRDLPTQPGQDLLAGTDEAKNRNMPKAFKGIGKPGKGGARM